MSQFKAKAPNPMSRLAAVAFRKYSTGLHRYILRRMRRESDIADLSQEIFERFLRVNKQEMVRNPQAYLFGIASHVVSDARMREDKNLVTYDSEILEQTAETLDHALPDTLAENTDAAQELGYALAKLPDTHRAVLLLVKRDGLSYQEVARQLNLTVATVTLYVFEARAKVKMLLRHLRNT